MRTQALQRIRTRPTCTHDSLKLLPGVGSGGGDETAVLQLAPLFARVAVGIPDDGGGHLGNVKSGRKRERKKRTNKQKRLKEVPRRRAPREVKQHKKAVPFKNGRQQKKSQRHPIAPLSLHGFFRGSAILAYPGGVLDI